MDAGRGMAVGVIGASCSAWRVCRPTPKALVSRLFEQSAPRGGGLAANGLFLDEPTIGLDPQTRSSIWRYIRALKETEGTTIFMTTHYMDEADLCDRIAIMDRGEIVVLDTPEALRASIGADRVVLGTADDAAALTALRALRHRGDGRRRCSDLPRRLR